MDKPAQPIPVPLSPPSPPSAETPGSSPSPLSSLGCISSQLLVDALAAATAAVAVAPVITVIDRAIMENASGMRPLGESLRAGAWEVVRRPGGFLGGRPFGLIFMLYTGTYMTANTIDTITTHYQHRRRRRRATPAGENEDIDIDIKAVHPGTPKFLATTAVNMSLCLYKDRTFTRLFSPLTPRPVPLPTYLLFSARDTLTIFFSFNLPPVLAPYLPVNPATGMVAGWEKMGWAGWRPQTVTQMVAPAVCQIASTPLHLWGLDLYNRPGVGGRVGRWGRVRGEWVKSALARMGRIVPAFGVGGVVNAGVRRWGLKGVEGRWR